VYGFLISFAILISILIVEWLAKRDKRDSNIVWDIATIAIVSGIIGARIYHVIDYWEYYVKDPIQILYVWHGGLGIFGAIVFGTLATVTYLKFKKQDIWYYMSIAVIPFPLAQAIGRWGNYFNKEMYGKVTNLPWGIEINGQRYHPLFLYESLLNLILFSILIWLKIKTKITPRKIVGTYLAGYGTIRFFLEFLKDTSWTIHNLNVAQLISIMFLGLSYLLISKKEPAQ